MRSAAAFCTRTTKKRPPDWDYLAVHTCCLSRRYQIARRLRQKGPRRARRVPWRLPLPLPLPLHDTSMCVPPAVIFLVPPLLLPCCPCSFFPIATILVTGLGLLPLLLRRASEVRPGQNPRIRDRNRPGPTRRGKRKTLRERCIVAPGSKPGCTFQDGTRAANHHMGQACWHGGRWQVAGALCRRGVGRGMKGGAKCSTRVRREQHQHARRPRGISARKTLCTVQ